MIEVEMGEDDVGDGSGIESSLGGRGGLDPIDPAQLLRPLPPAADIHQKDPAVRSDEEGSGRQPDAVLLVGGDQARPEGLGDRPEHRPTIETVVAVVVDGHLESPEGRHASCL